MNISDYGNIIRHLELQPQRRIEEILGGYVFYTTAEILMIYSQYLGVSEILPTF